MKYLKDYLAEARLKPYPFLDDDGTPIAVMPVPSKKLVNQVDEAMNDGDLDAAVRLLVPKAAQADKLLELSEDWPFTVLSSWVRDGMRYFGVGEGEPEDDTPGE